MLMSAKDLPESSDPSPADAGISRRTRIRNPFLSIKRYFGIGFLVAVGYIDPGNWATDIAAGSRFGYGLLWVVLLSCLAAMLLQTLCVRIGIASGRDLAQLCREYFAPRYNIPLWLLAQIAIIACDFAEVLGTALALKLLFGLPLSVGIPITALDTFVILAMQGKSLFRTEIIIVALVAMVTVAFGIEIALSRPDWLQILKGFYPDTAVFQSPQAWPLAIGILGATIMPHNLYLHSSAVNSKKRLRYDGSEGDAIRLLTWNTLIALSLALLVNASILIVAASVFHTSGHRDITEINDAYALLTPLLGTSLASILFGLALFASGQSSTITGTIAGQVILQGFLNLKISPWLQRLVTRLMALVPAWLIILCYGEQMLGTLLVDSQIILSMQLPFAMVPLIWFSSRKDIMGRWQLKGFMLYICWLVCAIITTTDLYLLYTMI